jgi:hypothetical protein
LAVARQEISSGRDIHMFFTIRKQSGANLSSNENLDPKLGLVQGEF